MISEKALTGAMFACFIALPFSIGFYLVAAMAMGGPGHDTLLATLFGLGCMLLPPSLVLGPIGGIVFQKLGWRRAAWTSILTPAFLIAFLVIMTALGATGVAEIP